MDNAELFQSHAGKMKLGETLATGYVREDTSYLMTEEVPPSAPGAVQPTEAQEASVDDAIHKLADAVIFQLNKLSQDTTKALESQDRNSFDRYREQSSKLEQFGAKLIDAVREYQKTDACLRLRASSGEVAAKTSRR